ncbi:MAG TPA: YiiX/YebB-like N1pC/P60 family cysteine hydrolase [Pseudomonadales bacterium]|nr:YiiX/YebB-like N1pC/P60 family cysteine hydrolase [Pseudomonadales bacterium]
MLKTIKRWLGRHLADYLSRPRAGGGGQPIMTLANWTDQLQPCDVLLVDGSSKVSTAIKYLTQSTWSHAAIYVGPEAGILVNGELAALVEADVREGVRIVPLSLYRDVNVRICRPSGLTAEDRARVIDFVCRAIGDQYDLRNVFDLMRYLLPEPPVPARWRRSLIALGSGEPTRAICSTLIAQAFQSVGYPILPVLHEPATAAERAERYLPRHYSFITPRDFDLSPYFRVVKPTLEVGFDYRTFPWLTGSHPAIDPRDAAVATTRPAEDRPAARGAD